MILYILQLKIKEMALGVQSDSLVFPMEKPSTQGFIVVEATPLMQVRLTNKPKVSIYGNLGINWRVRFTSNGGLIAQCSQSEMSRSVLVIG